MTTKLFNRSGRGESHVEGHDYLNIGGQFTSGESHKYITTGGHLTSIEVGPEPEPIVYTIELPDTVNGTSMFANDATLGDEVVYAPVLENGANMFEASSITSFKGDLPSLTDGSMMFNGCTALTSFSGDLSSLAEADNMFSGCTALTTFTSDLSALTGGWFMFYGCQLDYASVKHIAETINDLAAQGGGASMDIGVNITQEQQDEVDAIMTAKGWTVSWHRN